MKDVRDQVLRRIIDQSERERERVSNRETEAKTRKV
jgi:hypothetical protein